MASLTSSCSITEDLPLGLAKPSDVSYVWTGSPTISPSAFTVTGDATPADFTVVNHSTRAFTHLTVTKELSEGSATPPSGLSFDMSYTCTDQSGDLYTGAKSIGLDETWTTANDIPVGSNCTVTEGDLPQVAPRFSWVGTLMSVPNLVGEPTASGRTIEFDIPPLGADGPVVPAVLVTNELQRQTNGYVLSKTSDPTPGRQVLPGQTITYQVTVTPTGPGLTDGVVVTDDLSQVLPYATVSGIDAPQGTASVSGTTLTWDVGTVGPSEPLTLTYKAVVKAGAYDVTIRNAVTATGATPPNPCDTCVTTTEHPTPPAYAISKTADPASGSTVSRGQSVTYTVSVHNLSVETPLDGIVVSDDLSQVLAGATFDQVVSGGPASLGGTTLTWTVPTLAPDGTAVLRYRVTVKADAHDVTLRNVVTATGPVPPTSCDPCTTTHQVPPLTPSKPPLAFTGAEGVLATLLLALALLAAGAGAVLFVRRRRA